MVEEIKLDMTLSMQPLGEISKVHHCLVKHHLGATILDMSY